MVNGILTLIGNKYIMFKFLVGLLSLGAVSPYSTGVDTCVIQPQHGNWANGCTQVGCQQLGTTAPPPYVIDVQDVFGQRVMAYTPNTNYTVTLRSTNTSSAPCSAQSCFRGFVMNVGKGNLQRSNFQGVSDASTGAGYLMAHPEDVVHARSMISCQNGITHQNNDYLRRVKMLWLSPTNGTGFVTFKGIVVSTQRGLNYVPSFTLPEIVIALPSFNSSDISPSANRTARPTATTTRSSSATSMASWSSSITPSYTETPSASLSMFVMPSQTSTNTISSSVAPSTTQTPTTSETSSVSDSPSVSVSIRPSMSSSVSITSTSTNTITSFPTPDMTNSPSSSFSMTPTANSTANTLVIVQPGSAPSDSSSNHAVGITVGVLGALALVLIGLTTYQSVQKRKKLHSSRVIIVPTETITVNPTIMWPHTSMRNLKEKTTFEPTPVN